MKKSDIIENVAEKLAIDKASVENVFDAILGEITTCMVNREEVKIHGFGNFITRPYGERNCYNPITGEIMKLKPSFSPVFKPGLKLRNEVNK
jgi:integration host factor subunit alpha